jgi:hypothetical protein
MDETQSRIDANFFQLVLSLQMAAMQQMGKIASPLTGKVERDLTQAKISIDMLEMLSDKTQNNLTKEEKDLLDRILFELRMNYVDESKKPDEPEKTSEESGKEAAPESGDDKKDDDEANDAETSGEKNKSES